MLGDKDGLDCTALKRPYNIKGFLVATDFLVRKDDTD